jgi:type IV pilus assembly protein PilA
MRMNRSGFTLTEITIVAIIMVIMAALAIPNYFRTVEEARSNEAKANLSTIYFAQKIFKENSSAKKYYPEAGGSKSTATGSEFTDMKSNLNVDFTTSYYTIVVTTASGGSTSTYTAVATRNSGTRTYTLDAATGNIAASGSF